MTFKPIQTAWFETYTSRDLTVYAVDALAKSGIVEFYHNNWSTNPEQNDLIRSFANEYNLLLKRFEKELPADSLIPPKPHNESPEHLSESSLRTLRNWCAGLLRSERNLARIQKELGNLELLKELLSAIPDHELDLGQIKHESHILYKKIFCCPKGLFNHPSGKDLFVEVFPSEAHDFILILGTLEHSETINSTATLLDCREVHVPEWIFSVTTGLIPEIDLNLARLEESVQEINSTMASCREDQDVRKSLAIMKLINWHLENACVSSDEHKQCHIVGWTSAKSAEDLEIILRKNNIETSVKFSAPPESITPPVISDQPRWIRPFEVFVNLAGTPGRHEIDPSPLLALVVPLLFGYMFPDVGHGLILVLSGFILMKRIPQAQLLIPCGLVATVFGFVFGDIFGRHDIIEPIWLSPLESPLQVISLPMIFGALLITTGLIFSGIEASWRGELKSWMKTDASVLVLYLVMILGIFWNILLWLIIPIIVWYLLGTISICNARKTSCLINGMGNLLESIFRLILNSISFVRVGAFALAHSGTSHAANMLSDMIDTPFLMIVFLIFSHAFIIVLEGMIVFVQTTRLVLFEFFIRFLKADGRIFKPMHGIK